MGLRFRKSVKLAPGLRLNFSGSGLSLSAGPRGASVSFGSRGTYLNSGIPGTGLYARQRLGGSTGGSASQAAETVRVQVRIVVEDDGTVTYKDADGAPLPDYLATKAKREYGGRIRDLLEDVCEKQNAPVNALAEIHLHTPGSDERVPFIPQKFEEVPPPAPTPRSAGVLGWLWKPHAARVAEANRLAEAAQESALIAWSQRKSEFEAADARRKDFLERRVLEDTSAMEDHLSEAIQDISWPRETAASFTIKRDGRDVLLDVDLPEIEDMPRRTASVPARGYKLNFKPISETNVQKMYAAHVQGIGFRIIGEVFAVLPIVETVTLSAYSQRPNKANGVIEDEYLYSVRVSRAQWSRIDFSNLRAIDVAAALASFDLRRNVTKGGRFQPIEPFATGDLAETRASTWSVARPPA